MQFSTLEKELVPQAKKLWNDNFDDGTSGLCDFLFEIIKPEDIYIACENDRVVSMLMAAAVLEYNGKKGFYLYSACTDTGFRGRGYMKGLVAYAIEDQAAKGRSFCVLKASAGNMDDFWEKQGFDKTVYMRKAEIEVKRNIWQKADFDIVTASRFRRIREKNTEEKVVHYTPESYGSYTAYMYTCGGSTAENEGAYRVYFEENNRLVVKEILARSAHDAMKLLQAIRERTGYETATVYLSDNSSLFLGEGSKEAVYMTKGLDGDAYINLMFE